MNGSYFWGNDIWAFRLVKGQTIMVGLSILTYFVVVPLNPYEECLMKKFRVKMAVLAYFWSWLVMPNILRQCRMEHFLHSQKSRQVSVCWCKVSRPSRILKCHENIITSLVPHFSHLTPINKKLSCILLFTFTHLKTHRTNQFSWFIASILAISDKTPYFFYACVYDSSLKRRVGDCPVHVWRCLCVQDICVIPTV